MWPQMCSTVQICYTAYVGIDMLYMLPWICCTVQICYTAYVSIDNIINSLDMLCSICSPRYVIQHAMLYCICSHRYVTQCREVILYMQPQICCIRGHRYVTQYRYVKLIGDTVSVAIDMLHSVEKLFCICSHKYVVHISICLFIVLYTVCKYSIYMQPQICYTVQRSYSVYAAINMQYIYQYVCLQFYIQYVNTLYICSHRYVTQCREIILYMQP